MQMISASDHGHSGCQVPDHVVRGLSHSVFVVVEREVLLDQLLAGRHRDLHSAIDHWRGNVLIEANKCRLKK
jgi:DNA topoisomerase VI subunit A